MQEMQNPTGMAMSLPIYWHKNQLALTFFSSLAVSATAAEIVQNITTSLQELNTQALSGTPFILNRLNTSTGEANELSGIFVYSSPTRPNVAQTPVADIAVFCAIATKTDSMADSSAMSNDEDHTLNIVRHLNSYAHSTQDQAQFHAMPNWFWTGVPEQTHGCPVTPPFPVDNSGKSGQWKTFLPQSPTALQQGTGAGVTVFVLDAFPPPAQIASAAQTSGNQNILLKQMATGMVSNGSSQAEPPAISLDYTYKIPTPDESAVTGKDVYGRLSGFPMADHGLFIAGLVRDLAPDARIECIRVLNDFGVGDCSALFQALTSIERRLRNEDLRQRPVVINLSLVIGPPECDLARLHLASQKTPHTQSLPDLLKDLLNLMQSLAQLGAVFVASAGNDSDPRDFTMNPTEMRFNARYPAAFADVHPDFTPLNAIIPVGAVNQSGAPAAYSNYPGPHGIATYGGELPQPTPWFPSAVSHAITEVNKNSPVDALHGLYSQTFYPALSRNDRYPVSMQPKPSPSSPRPTQIPYPLYTISSTNAWAYWSGTSFAAPIIAALAARVLQNQAHPFSAEKVRTALANAGQQMTWTGLGNGQEASGPVISVTQQWQDES